MRTAIARFSLALVGSLAAAAHAQQPPPDFAKIEIQTTQIAADFYTLEGRGGTVSVLTGPEGVLLVDSQYAQLTGKLVAAPAPALALPVVTYEALQRDR
ncbi:MAG TPA: hypothetical protein VHW71_09100 [Steroidobacteraceae bacterium]|nr:hypothetical protein [Steroidobacteraceae bacterium]